MADEVWHKLSYYLSGRHDLNCRFSTHCQIMKLEPILRTKEETSDPHRDGCVERV